MLIFFTSIWNVISLYFHFTDAAKPQWTWICSNEKCERTTAKENVDLVSLPTCNALCSSAVIWPNPTGQLKLSNTVLPLNFNFTLEISTSPSKEVSEHLQKAFSLFEQDLSKYKKVQKQPDSMYAVYSLLISVSVKGDKDPRLRLNTDESYEIYVAPSKRGDVIEVTVSAKSFCGARHGFETLSQLIWFDPYNDSLLMIDTAVVKDKPSFHYRGLLLDTARNYFPVSDILRTIDAMAATKLNTFHWHAVDTQSFPLKLNSTMKLAKYGAYGPSSVYTRDDVQTIVSHARLRGIRVVLEIDAPGHVGSAWNWGPKEGLGDLAYCIENEPWWKYCGEPPCGQINPHNPHVLNILENIYTEIIQLTGVDDVFHLGGDEVTQRCWTEHLPECVNKPLCATDDAWIDFVHKAYKALERANGGKAPNLTIVWSSRLTKWPYLKTQRKFAIQFWDLMDSQDMLMLLMKGFRMVLSHVYPLYLDCGFGSWRSDGESHCGNYVKWQDIYNNPPYTPNTLHIVGGEACLWSEQVGPTDLDGRLWPRGAAFGEKMWTHPKLYANESVKLRLDVHRSRLVARGIRAGPIFPRWCSENPYKCI